jgi:hypothetical protein
MVSRLVFGRVTLSGTQELPLFGTRKEKWKKVDTQDTHTVEINRYNTLSFNPVTTVALRVEVEQAEDSSIGVFGMANRFAELTILDRA